MNLILTINDKYVEKIKVMLFSVSVNTVDPVTIYMIYSDVTEKHIKMLQEYVKLISDGRMELIPIYFETTIINDLPTCGDSWSIEIYFRLFAPYLIETDKALYLDGDTIVNNSIVELYESELGDNYILAVSNDITSTHNKRLNLPLENKYVNSGVLLMNLKLLRIDFTKEKIINLIKKYKHILCFPDQDFINIVFKGRIKILDNRYNYMISVAEINPNYPKKNQIVICHYVMEKPWDIKFPYKTDLLYFKYLIKTGKMVDCLYLWIMHRAYRFYQFFLVPKEYKRIYKR